MKKTIGFLGGGNMAEGIIRGILATGSWDKEEIFVQEILPARKEYLKDTYEIQLTESLKELAQKAQLIVLAVRPQDAPKVVRELNGYLNDEHILLSICAGIQIEKLSGWTEDRIRWARIMPNTMIESKRGYSSLAFGNGFTEEAENEVQKVSDSIGKTLRIPEGQFDAFTATSCAGPEWLILVAAALVDAAVETGLSRKDAQAIVHENLVATGLVLESSDKHYYQITDEMNTPGGIGIEGFHVFAKAGLHGIFMDGVKAAYRRTTELGKGE
jgi:pyrroline-5-carboxylate reductase